MRSELRCCAAVLRGYANQPAVRAGKLLACVAAAAALAGCAGTGFAPEPPAGASLAGAWKLDHAASDDPQKLLDQMRAQAFKIIRRQLQQQQAAAMQRPGPRGGQGGSQQSDDQMAEEEALLAPGPGGRQPDPLLRSPMAHIITETVARGDFLTVHESPGEFVLDYGTSERSFTPGGRSVVSAEGGVGDQTSGWKGREYVIEIKAQLGPVVTETYGLSADRRQLVEKLHIGGGELPAVNLTRIYNPTNEIAPRKLPTND
jgi:hypothetical protein